jgi:colanic acid biosynthesis glycosyl transferase WcaI
LLDKPKVYVWCQFFYPELISTGQVVTELFEQLSKQVQVEVHCAQPTIKKSSKVPSVLDHRGIKIVRLWSSTFSKISIIGKLINQITYSSSLFLKALFLPTKSRVNVFTDPFFLPLLLFILYPLKKFSYTITLFDLYPETLVKNNILQENSLLYRLLDGLTNKVYAHATNVITIGRCMQKIVSSRSIMWKRQPLFIPIWCDTENVRRKTLPHDYFRKLWNIEESCFVVGYSGNLAKFHPIETFTEAAFLLRAQKDIKFVFLGEGAKKYNARKFCNNRKLNNCIFGSYVERVQLGSMLSSFDCGLVGLNDNQTGLSVPSKTIGLMAAGVPVIACVSQESETALMLKENNCGVIVSPDCSKSLADTILRLKSDHAGREEFKKNSLLAVQNNLNLKIISSKYLKALSS